MKRSLTVAERSCINDVQPSLDTKQYLIVKKQPELYTLKHKITDAKKRVMVKG